MYPPEKFDPLRQAFQGHSRSSEPTRIDGPLVADQSTSVVTYVTFHSDHGHRFLIVSQINWDVSRKSQIFPTPRVFNAPLREFCLELGNSADGLNWRAIRMRKKFDDICSRLNTIHECDGQTDRHRPTAIVPCLCIASRGKSGNARKRSHFILAPGQVRRALHYLIITKTLFATNTTRTKKKEKKTHTQASIGTAL